MKQKGAHSLFASDVVQNPVSAVCGVFEAAAPNEAIDRRYGRRELLDRSDMRLRMTFALPTIFRIGGTNNLYSFVQNRILTGSERVSKPIIYVLNNLTPALTTSRTISLRVVPGVFSDRQQILFLIFGLLIRSKQFRLNRPTFERRPSAILPRLANVRRAGSSPAQRRSP